MQMVASMIRVPSGAHPHYIRSDAHELPHEPPRRLFCTRLSDLEHFCAVQHESTNGLAAAGMGETNMLRLSSLPAHRERPSEPV